MQKIIKYLGTKDFLVKILLPTFLSIVFFIFSIFQIMIPRFEETIIDRKREMIRELTNTAWSLIKRQDELANIGLITKENAKKYSIEQIRHLRYGDKYKDYFWITDYQPKMIMHPYRTELEGTDLSDFKDSHNKKLFLEIVNVVKKSGEGYVDYMWQWKDDTSRIVPKLSYVKDFKPWGWIIGTGIYIEDVKLEIASIEKKLINISIAIIIIISFLLAFITIQNINIETKRRRAEDELKESKEKYKTLVEATTEGLIMTLEGENIYYNKTLLSLLGYSDEEFLKLNLEEIFINNVLNAGISNLSQIETQIRKKDGSLLNVLITSSNISFMGKEGTIIIVRDISRHKEIEKVLGETKEKYLALTNQLTIGIFRADAAKGFKFIEVNPAIVNILGCGNTKEIYNYDLTYFFENWEESKIFWKELLRNGFIKNRIVQIRRLDSTLAIVSVSLILIKDEFDSPRFCDGIIEDITESKRTEEERENLISELQISLVFLNQSIRPFVKDFLAVDSKQPIFKVSKLMSQKKSEIALVKSSSGEVLGIITDNDITERFVATGLGLETPVYQIMSSPIISTQINSSIFESLLNHYEKNINQLVVKDENNQICGILSFKDILKASHLTYLFFIKNIQQAFSIDEIIRSKSKLLILIKALIDSGTNIRNITRMITIISDTITSKIISLAIEELGEPPVKFAFISLGSEGRKEQTLVTDQDNAIIYDDVDEGSVNVVQNYFLRLGEFICKSLNSAGYAFCKGNIMAMNPKWCQPISVWKKYFTDWVTTANPENLLDINIFFDFRTVFGDESLTEKLDNHIQNIISGNNPFFVYLTQNALKTKPPIGQLKSAEIFNIKLALLPIVDLIRIYSLRNKVKETNTLERIEQLYKKNIFSKNACQDLIQAYNNLMQMRFNHQVKMISENLSPDNNINPKQLTGLEDAILRKIFVQVADFQAKLSLVFKGTL